MQGFGFSEGPFYKKVINHKGLQGFGVSMRLLSQGFRGYRLLAAFWGGLLQGFSSQGLEVCVSMNPCLGEEVVSYCMWLEVSQRI